MVKSRIQNDTTGEGNDNEDYDEISPDEEDCEEVSDDNRIEESSDAWLLCLYDENLGIPTKHFVSLVAVDIKSNTLKHRYFDFMNEAHKLQELIELIEPKEIILSNKQNNKVLQIIQKILNSTSPETKNIISSRICLVDDKIFHKSIDNNLPLYMKNMHLIEIKAISALKYYLSSFNLESALDEPNVSNLNDDLVKSNENLGMN